MYTVTVHISWVIITYFIFHISFHISGVADREELVSQWIRTGVAGRKERLSQRDQDRGSGQGRTFIPERQLGGSLETV